ncbi:MAG: ATP-binding protein [Desulfovibrionales bacterium]
MKCSRCKEHAVVALPSHHAGFCKPCFLLFFKNQVQRSIKKMKLLEPEDRVLVAISGGKDSLALTWQLKDLGYDVTGLHIDLGIGRSSLLARQYTETFCRKHDIALHVLETAAEGLAMPEVKKRIRRPICSVCGSVKRHYFNRFAVENGFTALATGHNLNDEVSRLFSNVLSWDQDYLSGQSPLLPGENGFAKKVKPLYRLSEFETANFCFMQGIEYGYHPCPFSKGATFTFYKSLWEELEAEQPGRRISFYEGYLKKGRAAFEALKRQRETTLAACTSCGFPSSADLCVVCRIKSQMQDA